MSRVLNLKTINQKLLKAEYAVRGRLSIRAGQIKEELANHPSKFSFNQVEELNIGNPQVFKFDKVDAYRRVISKFIANSEGPDSLLRDYKKDAQYELKTIEDEVKDLAGFYNSRLSMGSYHQNQGLGFPQNNIAKFIEYRDGHAIDPSLILSANGASSSIRLILNLLIDSPEAGILCSVPRYPLYSGLIALFGGSMVPYYLDEADNWNISIEEIERSYEQAVKEGIKPKAIVVINPGNPTGSIITRDRIQEIIEFAYRRNLVILADEVYQENIYNQEKPFASFRKVTLESDTNIKNNLEVISFHSLSKGLCGECGLRGGYMDLLNINPGIVDSIRLLNNREMPNLIGDMGIDLKSGFIAREFASSHPLLTQLFDSQQKNNYDQLIQKAKLTKEILNSCENISSNPIEGAMYAFPQLILPKKFEAEAESQNLAPDLLYCLELLEQEGVCIVPGSGFGQVEGTHHFRSTILPSPSEKFYEILEKIKKFNSNLHEKYDY